jgi:hypothetical protein
MEKQFGINERKLKVKIPFLNRIMIISKAYHSYGRLNIRYEKCNWATNPLSVLEGLWHTYKINIGRNGVSYSIDFVMKSIK